MTSIEVQPPKPLLARVLPAGVTIGFAATVAMWVVGYVLHLPGLITPSPVVGVLLLLVMIAAGALAGGVAQRRDAWRVGFTAGLTSGLLNLMILGSLLMRPDAPDQAQPAAPVIVGGWILFSAALFTIAAAGRAAIAPRTNAADTPAHWLARFGALTVASVVALLAVGGAVTSTETGMAVPDWPATFGTNMFLYPLSRMTGGIYFEHAHRLFGALIGLTTMALFIFSLFTEKRRWLKILTGVAFVLVVVQGVKGGLRVELDEAAGLFFRMLHGFTAQIFLGLVAFIAAALSMTWRNAGPPRPTPGAGLMRGLASTYLVVLIIQIAFGVGARHTDGHAHALFTHVGFSIVAFMLAIAAGVRARSAHTDVRPLKVFGTGTLHAVGLQMALGLGALWAVLTYRTADPASEVLLATAHQVLGGVLVVLSVQLVVWSRRMLAPAPATQPARIPAAAAG
jgi:cytochrome c oxidase assembly protein subunit 15